MERDAEGRLAPPVGAPFSLRTGLVYPFGTARTDDGEDLAVIVPDVPGGAARPGRHVRQLRPRPQRPARHRDRASRGSAPGRCGDRLTWPPAPTTCTSSPGSCLSARSPPTSPTLSSSRPAGGWRPRWLRGARRHSRVPSAAASSRSWRSETQEGSPRSAAGPFAIGLAWAAFGLLAAALLLRGIAVGRGPWGNMYEFRGRVLVRDHDRVPVRPAAIPDPRSRIHPARGGLWMFLGRVPPRRSPPRSSRSSRRSTTRRSSRSTSRWAMISYGIFATSFAAAIGYLAQVRTGDRFAWLPSHKVLDDVGVSGRHHRLSDLRDDDHPRVATGRRSHGAGTGAGTRRRRRPSSRG